MCSKRDSIKLLQTYLESDIEEIQLKPLCLLITNVAFAFGENSHTYNLAKIYLANIWELYESKLAYANMILPITFNLLYPAYGADPIKLRRLHSEKSSRTHMQLSLQWDEKLYNGTCQFISFDLTLLYSKLSNLLIHAPLSVQQRPSKFLPRQMARLLADYFE